MVGVIGDRRGLQVTDGVAPPLVVVGELFPQSVDVSAAALEREIAEHVVERAVSSIRTTMWSIFARLAMPMS